MGRAYLWLQRHPRAVDAAVLGVVLVVGGPALVATALGGASAIDTVLALAVCLPLLVRRSSPVGAVLLAGGLGLSQVAFADAPSVTDVALAVVVYSGVAYGPRWLSVVCAAGSLAAPVVAAVRWAPDALDRPRSFAYLYVVVVMPFAIAWVVGQAARYRRAYLAGVEERAARLEHERDVRAGIAVAAERARIARDMHDVVAHAVSVMVVQASGAAYALDEHPDEARRALETVADTGRQTLAELRRVLGVLRPDDAGSPYRPQPGVAQLAELVAQLRAAGLDAGLTVAGVPVELSAGGQLAVYRLVQEALTNAVKHAGPAATVRVTVSYRGDAVEVEVVDDGRGTATAGPGAGGHGLVGMRERVALFDGELAAGPCPGRGYRVWARLPLAAVTPAPPAETAPAAPVQAAVR